MSRQLLGLVLAITCVTISLFVAASGGAETPAIAHDVQSSAGRTQQWTPDTPVHEVLIDLGVAAPKHLQGDLASRKQQRWAQQGGELFFQGTTTDPATRQPSPTQSTAFRCSHCHLTVREDPLLAWPDPTARLQWAQEKNLRVLPGTTMFGVVNKTSWFNGDYEKKYGDLVQPARKDLREAIQLCSKECSKGRRLEPWELESMLAYLWSLGYRLRDIGFDEAGVNALRETARKSGADEARSQIRARYSETTGATFGNPPTSPAIGYALPGDAKRGAQIYTRSCMACHGTGAHTPESQRGSFELTPRTLTKLAERATENGSLYRILRLGIYHDDLYMPQYTKERMSDQQIEDLRAFLVAGKTAEDSWKHLPEVKGAIQVSDAEPVAPPSDPRPRRRGRRPGPLLEGDDLGARAHNVLSRSCFHCHGRQAKGGFDRVLDFEFVRDPKNGYIAPGEPDKSWLLDLILTDEMPTRAPFVAEADKQLIRQWIQQGAPDPNAAKK